MSPRHRAARGGTNARHARTKRGSQKARDKRSRKRRRGDKYRRSNALARRERVDRPMPPECSTALVRTEASFVCFARSKFPPAELCTLLRRFAASAAHRARFGSTGSTRARATLDAARAT